MYTFLYALQSRIHPNYFFFKKCIPGQFIAMPSLIISKPRWFCLTQDSEFISLHKCLEREVAIRNTDNMLRVMATIMTLREDDRLFWLVGKFVRMLLGAFYHPNLFIVAPWLFDFGLGSGPLQLLPSPSIPD